MEINLIEDEGTDPIMKIEARSVWILGKFEEATNRFEELLLNKHPGKSGVKINQMDIIDITNQCTFAKMWGVFLKLGGELTELTIYNLLRGINKLGCIEIKNEEIASIYLECFIPVKLFIEGCFYNE